MSNSFGNRLKITLFGESHGEYIGATLDGFPAGIEVMEENIEYFLSKRRPSGIGETKRVEPDDFKIVSGVYKGLSTGAPITILIKNQNKRSSDYEEISHTPRPSHADYTSFIKYQGFADPRGGGRFSGRLTAPIVAIGGIIIPFLKTLGIDLCTHIKEVGGVKDETLLNKEIDSELAESILDSDFPLIDSSKEKQMRAKIEEVAKEGDSIGGVLETGIFNLQIGLGDPNFDSLESQLSHAIFSIPGIKGITFGAGFSFKDGRGSDLNDGFEIVDGQVKTKTNNNGGINGGISNGMPVIFQSIVKPTPSISKPQASVDLDILENTTLVIKGRHDPAFIRRVVPVINSLTAFVILDNLLLVNGESL